MKGHFSTSVLGITPFYGLLPNILELILKDNKHDPYTQKHQRKKESTFRRDHIGFVSVRRVKILKAR